MLDVAGLDKLFRQLRNAAEIGDRFDGLAEFFGALERHPIAAPASAEEQRPATRPASAPLPERLEMLFAELDAAMAAQRRSGELFNAWDILGLRRNEVRTCQVLRWLLAPDESHGLGPRALNGLLGFLVETGKAMPLAPWASLPAFASESCVIETEKPYGPDNTMRVDLYLEDPGFALIIEAKVGHREGPGQLQAYARESERRIGESRPWLLLFVTPDGRDPISAEGYENRVVSLSWSALARIMENALRQQLVGQALEKSPNHHARDHFVMTFLKNMKTFSRKMR